MQKFIKLQSSILRDIKRFAKKRSGICSKNMKDERVCWNKIKAASKEKNVLNKSKLYA